MLSFWRRTKQRKSQGGPSAKSSPRPRYRPAVEFLEHRLAPAVVTVTSTADTLVPSDGAVTLREAISAVNAGNDLGDPDITAQNPGAFGTGDAIHFSVPGTGVQTLSVASALPALIKPVLL